MPEQISNLPPDDYAEDVKAAITSLREAPEPVADKPVVDDVIDEGKQEKTETAEAKAERERDEQGRFVAKDKTEEKPVEVKPDKPVDTKPVEGKPVDPLKPAVDKPAIGNPPGAWSVKAKAQWDRLPQIVRDEIGKAASPEVDQLRPYMERAKQAGQTLADALQSYTGIEDLFRRDQRGGFLHIASNLGLTQHQAGQMFAQLAQELGVMPQAQANGHPQEQVNGDTGDPTALQRILAPLVAPLTEKLTKLEDTFRQQTEATQGQRQQSAMTAVEKFRSDPAHRYYDNLETSIADLLGKGIVPRTGDMQADLKAAYDLACRMDPEVSELLVAERIEKTRAGQLAKEKEAAAKAKAASRSITGSPSPGTSDKRRREPGQSYDDDLYADVTAAARSVAGRA